MASGLSSNVGRIINFPKRGRNGGPKEFLKVVVPLAVMLTWRIMEARQSKPAGNLDAVKGKVASKAKETVGKKGAPAGKPARKARHSARYYAITALITALENPTSRKVVISGLKLARNFL